MSHFGQYHAIVLLALKERAPFFFMTLAFELHVLGSWALASLFDAYLLVLKLFVLGSWALALFNAFLL